MTTDQPTAPTAEERRAALVERVAATVRASRAYQAAAAFGVPLDAQAECATLIADAVVVLLESGEAGAYLVGGSDLQEAVGIVFGRLRAAREECAGLRAELESLRALLRESNKPLLPGDWWDRVRSASRS